LPSERERADRGSPTLLVPREEAEKKITTQIEKGQEIRNAQISSWEALQSAETERSKWQKYTGELLRRLFDSPSLAEEFNPVIGFAVVGGGPRELGREVRDFIRDMDHDVATLESVRDRLELIPERAVLVAETQQKTREIPSRGRAVFIVHGHDEAAKQSVARFLEKLSLHAIVLHDQPDAGRTLIEKFEAYSDVGFAVVLLTPDDVGYPQNRQGEARPRARQNVIFELGFFIGKLGRGRVCALYKEGVEIPSDYVGVLYTPMDPAGAWQLQLAKEIRHSGIDINLDKLLET